MKRPITDLTKLIIVKMNFFNIFLLHSYTYKIYQIKYNIFNLSIFKFKFKLLCIVKFNFFVTTENV